jgi:RNA polymerase sigma factor (sigma-70 family)
MTRKELTDLVLLAQNGDKSALEQIYLLTYNSAYNKIFSAVNNAEEAEDLVHDCFVSVISNLSNLKEPKSFEKWFNAIIFNKIKDYKKKSTPVLLDEQEYNTLSNLHEENTEYIPFEKLERNDNIELTRKLVNELSDKNRQSIEMHYFENKSISEIADELNVSENTVKSRLHNGRNEIKRKAKVNTKKILITILIIVLLASITAFTVSSSGRFFSKILYKFHETFGELIGDPIHLKTAPKYFLDVYTLSYVPEGYALEKEKLTSIYVRYEFENANKDTLCFEQRTKVGSDYYIDSESGYSIIEEIEEFDVYYRFTDKNYHYAWNDGKCSIKMKSSVKLSNEEIIFIIDGITVK